MFKRIAAIAGASIGAAVIVGGALFALPSSDAAAVPNCPGTPPQLRTQTTVSAPYGVSAQVADLLTVKAINTSSLDCYGVSLVIHPRVGTVFQSLVSTGDWSCSPPAVGEPGDTYCYTSQLAKSSIETLRVQYNRPARGSAVSGTASADIFLDCPGGSDTFQRACLLPQ